MSSIEKLTERFTCFPGIGVRQARRFVYFLLNLKKEEIDEFITELKSLKTTVAQCDECFRLFEHELHQQRAEAKCEYCKDPFLNKSLLLVVEKDTDLHNIKKSGLYAGSFFVLNGLLRFGEEKKNNTRIRELEHLIGERGRARILHEIIFALGVHSEGDYTVTYLKQFLASLLKKYSIKTSALGRGLSTGTELEYSDKETLKSALENRK